MYDEVTC